MSTFAFDNKGSRGPGYKDHDQRDYAGRRSTHALRAAMRAKYGDGWSDDARTKAAYDKMRTPWQAAAQAAASKHGSNWDNKAAGRAFYRKTKLALETKRVKFIRAATKSNASATLKRRAPGKKTTSSRRRRAAPKKRAASKRSTAKRGWQGGAPRNAKGQYIAKSEWYVHNNPVKRGRVRHARRVASYR